ncbi:MAG: ABC transporter permease, partial [Alistipes sp.]|nr:ABC transporter permease [Alistipes sp.]
MAGTRKTDSRKTGSRRTGSRRTGGGWHIARRFLFSPGSHSVINIISRVSMVAVGIPVAAMVILMGVFSGFDDLIRRMYRDFDPDFLVQPADGKVFDPTVLDMAAIEAIDGVEATSLILEESAMAEYRGRQAVVTVRGVDSLMESVVPLAGMIYAGTSGGDGAVVGQGVAYEMGVRPGQEGAMRFFVPGRGAWSSLLPATGVKSVEVEVDGIFVLDAETDGEYVIVPIERARELFDYDGMASGLMIRTEEGTSARRVGREIEAAAGDDFRVLDRYRQKESMYRIMQMEKWGIFAIGAAVLIIASFSIVGSIIMSIIDKRGGIRTLRALGADTRFVRR